MISLGIKYLNIFEEDKVIQESLVYEKENKEKKYQTEGRCCFLRKEQQMAYAYIKK